MHALAGHLLTHGPEKNPTSLTKIYILISYWDDQDASHLGHPN
jgi:hypothetical protein